MKRLFKVALVLALFSFCVQALPQASVLATAVHSVGRIKYISVTLSGTEQDTVFMQLPYPAKSFDFALDTLKFNYKNYVAAYKLFSGSGDIYLAVTMDSLAGATAGQPTCLDSLVSYMKPYFYMESRERWYCAQNDSSFLDFTEAGSYCTTSIQVLDWTGTSAYGIQLSNEIWSCGGVAFIFKQYDKSAAAKVRLNFMFSLLY